MSEWRGAFGHFNPLTMSVVRRESLSRSVSGATDLPP